MVSSILTNNGAMIALQSLQATQKNLLDTQNRISTGLKVATAKDNAATWAVATSMRSDISNMQQVSSNLSTASSIVGTAQSGAEQIKSLIAQIKTKVTAAQDPSVDRSQVQNDIDQLVAQISSTIDSSQYNGVNLLNNSNSQSFVSSVNNVGGVSTPSYINVSGQDLRVTGSGAMGQLATVNVAARGDQLFATQTDGTRSVDLRVDTGGATSSGTFTINYNDKNGVAKSLTISGLTIAAGGNDEVALANALNGNAEFKALFKATGTAGSSGAAGDGHLVIQAADRDEEQGAFAITGISGSALTANASAATSVQSTTMTFGANLLKVGDTFTLDYTVNGANHRAVVQVGKGQTQLIASDGSTDTINLNVDNATSATNAAAELKAALLKSANFSGGAASASALLVSVDGSGGLTITSDGTAQTSVVKMALPTTDYAALLSKVDAAAQAATNAATAFGSTASRIDTQKTFIDKLVDTLTTGVGALVDADMSEEAARLQALQTQQQLGTQALSIANQAPQTILALFRG